MIYDATISVTYKVTITTDEQLDNSEVLDYIMDNVDITEHKIIDIDYETAFVEEVS